LISSRTNSILKKSQKLRKNQNPKNHLRLRLLQSMLLQIQIIKKLLLTPMVSSTPYLIQLRATGHKASKLPEDTKQEAQK
jgi:hypothetical protein